MAVKNTYKGKGYIKTALIKATEQGTKRTVGEILDQAVQDAPILNSDLRESGRIEEKVTTNGVEMAITFGNESVPYARRQHEELDWEHPRGGKAKYLEDAVKMYAYKLPKSVQAEIKKLR